MPRRNHRVRRCRICGRDRRTNWTACKSCLRRRLAERMTNQAKENTP